VASGIPRARELTRPPPTCDVTRFASAVGSYPTGAVATDMW